jgi:hypothetical protein
MSRRKPSLSGLASKFFSSGSVFHSSSAEVQHGSGDDDGGDTRKGTWERAEEMELSLEQ